MGFIYCFILNWHFYVYYLDFCTYIDIDELGGIEYRILNMIKIWVRLGLHSS